MAPVPEAPMAPSPNAYTRIKTPDAIPTTNNEHSTKTKALSWATIFTQCVILASIVLYVFGQVIVLTPTYTDKIKPTIQGWWGVPTVQPKKGGAKGHAEMTRPTFFTLFAVLPLLVSVLLLECLRRVNVRRVSSQFVLRCAMVLRRKPSLFGNVSFWSYGEWLFFVLLVGGNVFVFARYYQTRLDKLKKPTKTNKYLEELGLTFGFVSLFNMAFLFLPATRNCVWMEFFNISYANGIKYHRWIGVATVATALLHCVMYYASWIRQKTWRKEALPCFDCAMGSTHGTEVWVNVFGEIAMLLFLVMALTALPFVRRQWYNLFYYSHQLLYVAVVFLALHWLYVVWWLLPTFLLFCFSRTVSASNGASPVEIQELTAISDELVKVAIKRSPGRDGHYKVGQFLYLNVPAISKLQWHAFTVASSPTANPTTVTVLLKARGDWTQDLLAYANDCQQKNVLPTVYVDGFYGSSLEMYDEYATVCLVAGGIGVTPILAILDDLTTKLHADPHHAPLQQNVAFIFSFRELALLNAVAPVLLKLRELDPHQQRVSLHLTLTSTPSDDQLDAPLRTTTPSLAQAKPTQYEEPATRQRRVLTQPLHSRKFKSLAYVVSFVVAIALVAWLEYGTKIKRQNANLWPLQLLMEIVALMGSVVIAVTTIIWIERAMGSPLSSTPALDNEKEQQEHEEIKIKSHDLASVELHTYRELLAELGVVVGDHPNMATLLQQIHDNHTSTASPQTPIGVFASGPTTLKRDVEVAIAHIDSRAFDLRQEQFEL